MLLYFHPKNQSNARLVQFLTFFMQAFASASSQNQILIAKVGHIYTSIFISRQAIIPVCKILVPVLHSQSNDGEGDDTFTNLNISSIMSQAISWTSLSFLKKEDNTLSSKAHLELATSICEELLLKRSVSDLSSKTISSHLSKLNFSSCSREDLQGLLSLSSGVLKVRHI